MQADVGCELHTGQMRYFLIPLWNPGWQRWFLGSELGKNKLYFLACSCGRLLGRMGKTDGFPIYPRSLYL